MSTEVDLIPQLDDLVDCRQAVHNRARKQRREFQRQPVAALLQYSSDQPNDDRTDQHLHCQVCELVILHWPKLMAVHVKEVSERINLQRCEDESQ